MAFYLGYVTRISAEEIYGHWTISHMDMRLNITQKSDDVPKNETDDTRAGCAAACGCASE